MLKKIVIIILLIGIVILWIQHEQKVEIFSGAKPRVTTTNPEIKPIVKQRDTNFNHKIEPLPDLKKNEIRLNIPPAAIDIKKYKNFIEFQNRKMEQMTPEARAMYLNKMKRHPLIRRNPKVLEALQAPPER